jgi:hypothetical protein
LFEAAAAAATVRALAGLTAGAFASARLRLVPALRVHRLRHDVAPLWGALVRGAPAPRPAPRETHLAVWRHGFEVFHAPVPADEARALAAARRGATLGEVLAAFQARPDPAAEALAAVESWFDEGWIAAVGPPRAAAGDG